jgi:hypothetical protein
VERRSFNVDCSLPQVGDGKQRHILGHKRTILINIPYNAARNTNPQFCPDGGIRVVVLVLDVAKGLRYGLAVPLRQMEIQLFIVELGSPRYC